MSTTLKDKFVKIRKPHYCFGCQRKFEIGTVMNYWVGVTDGDFGYVYICRTCYDLMGFLYNEDGYDLGFVNEELNENETPEELLERMKENVSNFRV